MSKKAVTAANARTTEAVARNPKAATRSRSAETGRMVSKAEAKANPATTVTEKVAQPAPAGPARGRRTSAAATESKLVIPKKMGEVADLLYSTREDRLALQKKVDALEAFEKKLKAHVIDNLPKSSATGAAGTKARVQVVTQDEPQVQDWDATYAHIKKTGNFDLLNRALNKSAVKERWENKKEVPGVGHFTVTKVSVTKL